MVCSYFFFLPTTNDNGLLRAFILSSPLPDTIQQSFLCACEKHLQCHFTALASNRCDGRQLLLWCLVPHQKAQIIHVKLQFTSVRSPFDSIFDMVSKMLCFFVTSVQSIGVLRPVKSYRKEPFCRRASSPRLGQH